MNALFVFLLLFLTAWVLAGRRSSRIGWLAVFGVAVFVAWKVAAGPLAAAATLAGLGVWLAVAASAAVPLRRNLVSLSVLSRAQAALSLLTPDDRVAVQAAGVGYDRELFSGTPNFRALLDLDTRPLAPAEQAFLDGPVTALCAALDEREIAERGDLPPPAWTALRAQGLFGMNVPRAYGGPELSLRAQSETLARIAGTSPSAALDVIGALVPAELILAHGSDAQRAHYLPRLARGEEIPCMVLAALDPGDDAGDVPPVGVVCETTGAGAQVPGIRLQWAQRQAPLAPLATFVVVAFRLEDPDGLLGGERDVGITIALIPADHPGVETGPRHRTGCPGFHAGPAVGTNVTIPMSFVLGGEAGCGRGLRMAAGRLTAARALAVPTLAAAALKRALQATSALAVVRERCGRPMARSEGVQAALARLVGDAYSVEAARRVMAAALERGETPSVRAAAVKFAASARLSRGIDAALNALAEGGLGAGPGTALLAAYAAAPSAARVTGADILLRSRVAFSLGIIQAHPFLPGEIEAVSMRDPDRALEAFDAALNGHAVQIAGNAAQALFKNLTVGILGDDPSIGISNYWFGQLARASVNFALVADAVLLSSGGALLEREALCGRLADVIAELTLASAALKRFEDDGRPVADEPVIEYTLRAAVHTINSRLSEVLDNLPSGTLSFAVRRVVFPFGTTAKPPSDRLTARVAALATRSGGTRERLLAGLCQTDEPADPAGRLERAFSAALAAEDPAERLRRWRDERSDRAVASLEDAVAAGVITGDEAERVRRRDGVIREALGPDELAPTAG